MKLIEIVKAFYEKHEESLKRFFSTEMTYHAASLSFYTIFAIVPLMLVFITIMANLPSFETYYIQIKEMVFSNLIPSKSEALAEYMDSILKNGFKMGIMGVFSVILTSLLFFDNYEYIVSKIFHKPKKTFFTALSTYWTLVTLMPLFFALVIYVSHKIADILGSVLSWVGIPISILISLITTWLLFFILMKVSINFKVSSLSVAKSALSTAIMWYVAQKAFTSYIFANTTYASIYGSFSSVLFFFLWIYLSWIIYLYGLKSTAVFEGLYQNKKRVKQERKEKKLRAQTAQEQAKIEQ